MVAKFLDDNKPKITLKREYALKKKTKTFCIVFTKSMRRAREIRKFHIAVMQRWQKSLMYVQSCCFANINLRIFCRSCCRRRGRYLGSPLLWSKHFATMVTWRYTSPHLFKNESNTSWRNDADSYAPCWEGWFVEVREVVETAFGITAGSYDDTSDRRNCFQLFEY